MESDQNPITLCKSFQFYSSLLSTVIWKQFVKIACLVMIDFTYQIGFFHPGHLVEHLTQKYPEFK